MTAPEIQLSSQTLASAALLDIRVVSTDAESHFRTPVQDVLSRVEAEKKNKYKEACNSRGTTCNPFVSSVDGVHAREALVEIY